MDHYTFTASSGDVVTVKFANLPAGNPSVRLYDPSGVLVTAGTDGNGLAAELAAGGSYDLVVGSDNAAGAVTGAYFGSLVVALGACSLTRRPRWRCPRATPIGAPTLQVVPGAYLSQSPGGAAGLTGSYVNAWLGWYTTQDDWRSSQTISGVRVDPTVNSPPRTGETAGNSTSRGEATPTGTCSRCNGTAGSPFPATVPGSRRAATTRAACGST